MEREMKKTISVLAVASVFAAGSAFAAAYRIPEQSIDSTAKAGANIAGAEHADTSYFNPANMSWIENAWQTEVNLNYIHLSSIEYSDARSSRYSGSSKEEDFLLPTLFLVSPEISNFRFGFSITAPYGLAKRWDDPYPKTFAEKFDLKVFDFNTTVSYKINNMFSVAGGVRLLYSTATVASDGRVADGVTANRYIDGDTTGWGYNLAVSARPTDKSNISITYRSNVDLDLEGDATLATNVGSTKINTVGNVTVPAPAVLSISGSYLFFEKLTVELTWDRTFWSKYENLDFNYDTRITNPVLYSAFDAPKAKNWDDASAYRLGLTYKLSDMVTLLAGFAYDESPVPDKTLGFELPDSDAYLFSAGARFKVTKQTDLGIGVLYDSKKERTVNNGSVNGTFKDASALLVSAGLTYTF
jgi:long-chain fatty acid transport protein